VWCLPVIEQLTGSGRGNLGRIAAAAARGEGTDVGWGRSARLMAEVFAGAPWFTGRSFDGAVPRPDPVDVSVPGVISTVPACVTLGLVLAGLLGAGVVAWRSARTGAAAMSATAAGALVAAVVALATSPINAVGIAVHQFRWLWPVAAFGSAALVTVLLTFAARTAARGWVAAGCAGLAVVAAVAVITDGRPPGVSSAAGLPSLPAARELVGDLDSLEGRGPVLFDPEGLTFAEPYSGLLFAELQDRGIPFVFDDEVMIRHFGEGRRNDGSATLRLRQVQGRDAVDVPAGFERVGFAEGPGGPVALIVEPLEPSG
jgi:hypothetical protein